MKLREGFTLTESVVAILLISIVFTVIAYGLSSAISSVVVLQNFQKVTELQNFIARWVYIQTDFTNVVSDVNSAFYGSSSNNYPRVSRVTASSVGTYFDKFVFTIEYAPGKFQVFTVYKYKPTN
ncbi:MAG: PulJ/GspJ family protein [Fervidobacterium sp.]